uniref:CsiFP4 chain A n=1 Tax=Clytia TaxID=13436 RepID=UPI002888F8E1
MNMNIGSVVFQKPIPFVVQFEGDINGKKFSVAGKGIGDANSGKFEGKHICTTGDLPISWGAIACLLQYGMPCFAKYPNDVPDYIKSTFPEGFQRESLVEFGNDGRYIAKQKVTLENGIIYNRGTITGDGFNENGKIMRRELQDKVAPMLTYYYPEDDGLKCIFNQLINGNNEDFQEVKMSQKITPLSDGPTAPRKLHYQHITLDLRKDSSEAADHIVITENAKAVSAEKYAKACF